MIKWRHGGGRSVLGKFAIAIKIYITKQGGRYNDKARKTKTQTEIGK